MQAALPGPRQDLLQLPSTAARLRMMLQKLRAMRARMSALAVVREIEGGTYRSRKQKGGESGAGDQGTGGGA